MSSLLRHRNLALLLLQARESVMAEFRPLLNEHGLTEQQWRVIRALLQDGPLEPRQLCERCQIVSPSLTGVLARMEELDLVTRERMADDQRRLRVSLTARSKRIAAKMAPHVEARYAALERDLGPELTAQLYATLDLLLERLAKRSR
ncbi:MAG TPA: homoprotocatechuate degradation operon regulator HpaR [Burkholderiaceae bacterium]